MLRSGWTWFLCGVLSATVVAALMWPEPVRDVEGAPAPRRGDGLLPVRDVDRAWAVEETCKALLDGRCVWIDGEYKPFPNSLRVTKTKGRYFENKTTVPDAVFRRLGFIPLDSLDLDLSNRDERMEFYAAGNMRIRATFDEQDGRTYIWFSYVYGDRGGRWMAVTIRRDASGVHISYWTRQIS